MPEDICVALTVTCLPFEIQDRVKRTKIKTIDELTECLGGMHSNRSQAHRENEIDRKPQFKSKKEECKICVTLGFPNRFHPSEKCWNKEKKSTVYQEGGQHHGRSRRRNRPGNFDRTFKLRRPAGQLVRMNVRVNDNKVIGVHDSGATFSALNESLCEPLKLKIYPDNSPYYSSSGIGTCLGRANVKLKIGKIEDKMNVSILKKEAIRDDMIIGLDSQKKFKLSLNENQEVRQKITKKQNETRTLDSEELKEIESKMKHIEDPDKIQIINVMKKHAIAVSNSKYDIGRCKTVKCTVPLKNDSLITSQKPYRTNIIDQKRIDEIIDNLLRNHLIEPCYSSFSAPVALVGKKDEGEKSRLVINYSKLNENVQPDAFPFPRIEDLVDRVIDCKFFTTLDINSAFWTIEVVEEDRDKLPFTTVNGIYRPKVMPFGFKNAPAVFQRALSSVLAKYKLTDFASNYMDDILVFSKTIPDHATHIKEVLVAMEKEEFKIKLSKCEFAKPNVKYLVHTLAQNQIKPLNDNLASIKLFPAPKTFKQVRQFLGKVNYYHKFIENCPKLLEPMYELLRKDKKFEWSEACQKSFDTVKTELSSYPTLAIFDPEKTPYIYTDASKEGIGAVLKQYQQDGVLHPIGYFSLKNSESESRQPPIILECRAIIGAIQFWHHYLFGRHFVVFSDHKPLENLKTKNQVDTKLGEMLFTLSQYDFKVIYRKGSENEEADALSRNPVLLEFHKENYIKICNLLERQEIIDDQKTIDKNSELCEENEIIYRLKKGRKKILISDQLDTKLIEKAHVEFGHIGTEKLTQILSEKYMINNLTKKVTKFTNQCKICICNKSRSKLNLGLMSRLGPAERPFQIMSIDTVGGFKGARSNKSYLHILIDHFTRYVWVLSSSTQSAENFIRLITPIANNKIDTLLADQYTGINSNHLKNFLKNKNIKLILTAVNSAQSNGLNERVNQTLVNRLRCAFNENDENRAWSTLINETVEKYNDTPHSSTGFTPNFLLYGNQKEISPFKEDIDLEEARKRAMVLSTISHNRNKKRYDKNRTNVEFDEDELVYVESGNKLNRKKLNLIYIGPFKILKKISKHIYQVETCKKRKENNIFHISKLMPFIPKEGDVNCQSLSS